MPRGDGTGPSGNGPLNNGTRGSGRGRGQRRNIKSPGNCRLDSSQNRRPVLKNKESGTGGYLQGAVLKALSMAVLAIPALFKIRNRLGTSEKKELLEQQQNDRYPTIEVTPVSVEEKQTED